MATVLAVVCAAPQEGSAGPPQPLRPGAVPLMAPPGAVAFGYQAVSEALDHALDLAARLPHVGVGVAVGEVEIDLRERPDAHQTTTTTLTRVDTVTTVVEQAAQLARRVGAGRVGASDVARLLSSARTDVAFTALDEPPGASVVHRVAPSLSERAGLPRQLDHAGMVPFVHRPQAWSALDSAWQATLEGQRRVACISGEAGAGKTRLLGEFARAAASQDGAIVLYGASTEDVEAPFQPFVEAVQPLLDQLGEEALATMLSPTARDDLALLLRPRTLGVNTVPDDGVEIVPGTGGEVPARGADTDRHWAFEALVDLLAAVSATAPVLWLVDDLHWASRPTVRLLEHLVRSGRLSRVCIAVAFRDTTASQTEAFADAIGELSRRPGVQRVELSAFDATAVAAFVAAAIGEAELPRELSGVVTQLLERSEGNAFLLAECWRQLRDSGKVAKDDRGWQAAPLRSDEVPASVREVTQHYLARLPEGCRRLLSVGACLGMTFELSLVANAAGEEIERALDLLSQTIDAGLLAQAGPGRFRFVHALVRQAIEDGLTAAARPQAHRAIAHTLLATGRANDTALAYHFGAAVPLEPSSIAVSYARRAAAQALQTISFEGAIEVLRSALAITTDPLERADVLTDLAIAAARGGASLEAARSCLEAAALAREHNAPERLVRAAQAMAEATWRGALFGAPSVGLIQEALELPLPDHERCRLLGGLSAALALSGNDDGSDQAGAAAIALAETLGDDALLLDVLHNCGFAALTPQRVHDQLAQSLRGVALAARAGDAYGELRLSCKAMLRLFVVPQPETLATELARHRRLSARLRQPYYLLVEAGNVATIALGEGRFADAEASIEQYQAWAEVNGQADSGYGIQMFSLRREQGRLAELRPMLELGAKLQRNDPSWAPGLAVVYAEAGMGEAAKALLDRILADGLDRLPRDTLFAGVLSYLADAAWLTGHAALAGKAIDLLAPYEGLMVYLPGLACYGAADRYLGKLQETAGHTAAARQHYEAGLALDERTGWPAWIAHSQFCFGQFLARHGEINEASRAQTLLTGAHQTAARLGMGALEARSFAALHDLAELGERTAPDGNDTNTRHRPGGLTARELEVLRHVATGKSNREIGLVLHASQHTIANHVRAILAKIDCANRTEATTWAHRRGLTQPD